MRKILVGACLLVNSAWGCNDQSWQRAKKGCFRAGVCVFNSLHLMSYPVTCGKLIGFSMGYRPVEGWQVILSASVGAACYQASNFCKKRLEGADDGSGLPR